MENHIQIPILDQTPPTEAIKIEEGTKVNHSIVEIPESNGYKAINQIFDERFKQLDNPSTESTTLSTTIFRVDVRLRESNPAAYTPMLLSIGPYHKSPKYRSMEKYKLLYLRRFLNRKKEFSDVGSCMRELDKLKDEALLCYDDRENLGKDIVGKFSEIMLLDGCFLVEFIRELFEIQPSVVHYRVINNTWMIYQVLRDMVLLENQLPFFVLTMLHDMTKCDAEESFLYMVRHTLLNVFPKKTYVPKSEIDIDVEGFDHLLHVVHMLSCPPEMSTNASKKKGFCNVNIFFGKIFQRMKRSKEISYKPDIWRWFYIPSATELYEAGVGFMKIGRTEEDPKDKTTLLDIEFENGLLRIPCFAVEDSTETILRNMIAYEERSPSEYAYFSDYALIMSQLIISHKDVQVLRESGIILNELGDDEAVANIFNKLGNGVLVGRAASYYKEQCIKLNLHRRNPTTKMMAYLRKWTASLIDGYFSNPWAAAATLGAIILLIVAIIQTVLAFKGIIK